MEMLGVSERELADTMQVGVESVRKWRKSGIPEASDSLASAWLTLGEVIDPELGAYLSRHLDPAGFVKPKTIVDAVEFGELSEAEIRVELDCSAETARQLATGRKKLRRRAVPFLVELRDVFDTGEDERRLSPDAMDQWRSLLANAPASLFQEELTRRLASDR